MNDDGKNSIFFSSNAQTENDARLNLLYEIGRILASGETMNEAAPQILEAICRNIQFELGELWCMDKQDKILRLENAWHLPSPPLENFVAESRQFKFTIGLGLPGKVWAKNAPVWLENIVGENYMPRRIFAVETGLQSGFAFPILLGEKLLGVFSFFSCESRQPDEALLQMFAAVGSHIGQFIKREKIESNLRESEDRYRAFIKQSTEGIWRFELDEKIPVNLPTEEQIELMFRDGFLAECNDAMAQMYGLQRAEDLVGSRVSELLDMADAANVEYLRAFIESGYNLTDAESHEKDRAGNDKFFLNSLVGSIENGNLLRVWGTQRDITRRKRAEQALRESEESYRIVAETASDAIIKIDEQSTILFANHSVERIFGHTSEEMLGQPLTMIIPEDLRERHQVGLRRYLATGERHLSWAGIEIPALHADGHTFPLEVSFGEYKQNGRRFFIGIARDITRRKQFERALIEREQLALLNSVVNRALIENNSLPDILHACTEAVVEHLDAAFARIWTLNKMENVLELQASSGIYTHLDGEHSRVPVSKFKIGLIAEERKPHLTNSVVGDHRIADQAWAKREGMVAFAGYPLIVEERLVGVIGMFARQPLAEKTLEALTAVSNAIALGIERKQTEAERERLLISEQQARENAESANHAKDEFIAIVSHELRSPLNAMLGWTRILQEQKPNEEMTNYALDVIVRNARSQSKLIEDLLDIARLNEGKLRLELLPIELAPIIVAAVETIKPTADAKNICLNQSLDKAANFIIGDGERLRQVVENLLSNAVKFTPEGGTVDVQLKRKNDEAKIVISDTGQGISAEFLPQIFERFKQADPSTTRRHGGLGIGLSLAWDLVELHGGTISAQSAGEGTGAIFTVSLPLRMVAPIKENSSGKVETMDSQGKLNGFWILAVDDEADAREIVSFMLQINGARVTTANSAVEALEILKESNGQIPDVLLSDISMPNESGYALLEKIRALPRENGGQIPAVALTAFNRPEDRQNAFEAGFQKHLGKPVEMEDLISAIIETASAK
ncbi:MAG: PAS domain S-box protein [Acidobacteriota bacterium]|nr:PAS domain S-box protein [Acidobacteriota bacterium]